LKDPTALTLGAGTGTVNRSTSANVLCLCLMPVSTSYSRWSIGKNIKYTRSVHLGFRPLSTLTISISSVHCTDFDVLLSEGE
jgi:hypothetical protein